MKKIIWLAVTVIILIALFFAFNQYIYNEKQTGPQPLPVEVTPITHATGILEWASTTIYMDPTGGEAAFAGRPSPSIIVVTDIHGDHFSTTTLEAVTGSSTLIVPQAVKDLLPASLAEQAKVLKNGESITEKGFVITAIPMYNLPEASDNRHTKGRGNGYVIERDDFKVYIAGDTAGIPEMRALTGINIAFVPMNPPFTMTVEEAADAVLAFKPTRVYPFHYRGQNGLNDINKFKELINAGNLGIEVILLNWYPTQS